MNDWWKPILFAVGLAWCSWELWRGATQGVTATQIREFRRQEHPTAFWMAMILNLIVVCICAWFLWHWVAEIDGSLA